MTKQERIDKKAAEFKQFMASQEVADEITKDAGYCCVWGNTSGTLDIRFEGISADHARAIMAAAKACGAIAELKQRDEAE